MKKLITIILTLSMLVLLVVPSFADSKEEAVILEAAKKGTVVYHLGSGQLDTLLYIYDDELYEESNDIGYSFMRNLLPEFERTTYNPHYDQSQHLTDECVGRQSIYEYVKLGGIQDLSDLEELCDAYLCGFTEKMTDENMVQRLDCGCYERSPLIVTIGDSSYIRTKLLGFDQSIPVLDFEKFKVKSYDDKNAVVEVTTPISALYENETCTINLINNNEDWKICGGTLFTEYFPEHGISYCFAPSTGENFSLVTHTIVIAVSVVLMVLLSKRRRKIDNI